MRQTLELMVMAAGLLVAGGLRPSEAGVIVANLRHSSSDGHTRLVLETTGPAAVTHQRLENPARIVIDVDGTASPDLKPLVIDDGLVARVRVGTHSGKARFVLDVSGVVDYRVFEIPAGGKEAHRCVVDVFGRRAAAASPKNRPAEEVQAPDPARPATVKTPSRSGPFIIVVDAGHGGQDPGARGFSLEEKDVCLEVARGVVEELNRRDGYRAFLTRDSDTFIPLRGRTKIAETKDADAFVSIHANASRSSSAHGTEVYFLSLSGATDEASRELARLENSADLMGGVTPEAEDDLSGILFDMQQTDVQQKGSLLAESVVNSLRNYEVLTTRGVKQAGFVVLKSPRIPSILVETAFITNPSENKRLRSGSFKKTFSRRVAEGIVRYFESVSVAELR